MPETDPLLKNRLIELAHRSLSRECYVYSEFLSLAEQDTLHRISFDMASAPFILKGGYDSSERKLACFGNKQLCGYSEEPPIVCIHISPVSKKFAEVLTHRDFLGSLMGLGFRRNVLGDIVVNENNAYLFCLESVSIYILEQFTKVKHTIIQCTITDLPLFTPTVPDLLQVTIASERLDAIISAVYKLSRSESQKLFTQAKVFVNSRLTENTSHIVSPGNIISIRGFGRFLYEGIERETRKGRLRVSVRVFK